MRAYSLDLRQRVVHSYEQGEGLISEIATRFGVSTAFVKKLLYRWRSTGDLAPLAHGGGKPKSLSERQHQLLKRKVREQADVSLAELQSFLDEKESVQVHVSTISRALSGLGLPLKKKSLVAGERNAYKIAWYWRRISWLDHRRLRFIDEAGANLAMTRLRGRAPRGQRVRESVPRNYGPQTSLIGTLSLQGIEAVMTLEGAVDTDAFNAHVEHFLRPTIKRGDVLVLDNLTAHHASRIEEVAAECGAEVIWLSPYSPDFSPIELMWSKIKTALRAAKARTREELERAFKAALELITSTDCSGWFTHCGYQVTSNCN